MRRWLGVLGLICAGLLQLGCEEDTLTNLAECPEVVDIRLDVVDVQGQSIGSLPVGSQARLDLTPLDVWRTPVNSACHASRVQWRLDPAGIAQAVGQFSGFNPTIVALAPGNLVITGCVNSICAQYGLILF